LNEALCGFSTPITHLDGRTVLIKCSPGKVIEPGIFIPVIAIIFLNFRFDLSSSWRGHADQGLNGTRQALRCF
jgi:hypothetical protein